jgi:hypothetical protein
MTREEKTKKLIQMVINLNAGGVDQLGSFYVSLNQEIENVGNILQGLSNQMIEHKVNLLQRTLGTKPEHLKSKIKALTVWGVMTTILECIDSAPGELPLFHRNCYSTSPAEWTKWMTAMDADLMATASSLTKAVQAQDNRIDVLQKAGILS